jgi:adenine-specific DNA-methyltransferase
LDEIIKKYEIQIDKNKFARAYTLEDARVDYRDWLGKQDVSGGEAAYKFIDDEGEVFRPVSMAWPNKKTAPDDYFVPLIHPKTKKPCPLPERGWRNPSSTMKDLLAQNLIIFGNDESTQPTRKYLLRENMDENVPSVLPFGGSDDALLKQLGIPFDNPKPVDFVKSIISYFTGNNGIVVDFFAGSATVGHACLELQSEGRALRFILVQIPEKLDADKAEHKAGVQFCKKIGVAENIAEISKERIRRAGKKIKNDNVGKDGIDKLDIGFRVLKIDSSNMSDVFYSPDEVKQGDLLAQINNIREGRNEEDLLFQVLLDWGVDLSLPITREVIAGKNVFFVDGNVLAACFEVGIEEKFVKLLAAKHPLRAVFFDASFASDSVKINIEQIFKLISPTTEIKTI